MTYITETSNESADIIHVAIWIANALRMTKTDAPLSVAVFAAHLGVAKPQIKSRTMQLLLYKLPLRFAVKKNFKMAGNTSNKQVEVDGAYFSKTKQVIISDTLLTGKSSFLVSVVSHEVQHALDDFNGIPFKASNDLTDDEYRIEPSELNARFAQALLQLVNDVAVLKSRKTEISNTKLMSTIDHVLEINDIKRNLFAQGADGDKIFNRFRIRAFKFYGEVDEIIAIHTPPTKPANKQSLKTKLSMLIKKFLF
jgi:hypothetical protein